MHIWINSVYLLSDSKIVENPYHKEFYFFIMVWVLVNNIKRLKINSFDYNSKIIFCFTSWINEITFISQIIKKEVLAYNLLFN